MTGLSEVTLRWVKSAVQLESTLDSMHELRRVRAGHFHGVEAGHDAPPDTRDHAEYSRSGGEFPPVVMPGNCVMIREDLKRTLGLLRGVAWTSVRVTKCVNASHDPNETACSVTSGKGWIGALPDDPSLRRTAPRYFQMELEDTTSAWKGGLPHFQVRAPFPPCLPLDGLGCIVTGDWLRGHAAFEHLGDTFVVDQGLWEALAPHVMNPHFQVEQWTVRAAKRSG